MNDTMQYSTQKMKFWNIVPPSSGMRNMRHIHPAVITVRI